MNNKNIELKMEKTKGIILAGGSGTRLYPITQAISKQLLPVYDKPMIYYPLSVLMLAGISDILIITTRHDNESFKRLLGNGSSFGINIEYAIQETPNGIAEAFIIGEDFIGDSNVCLILGDNIFWGQNFRPILEKAKKNLGATIFGYEVIDPERFGVVEFRNEKVLSIEEKPKTPKSNYAVTGLYFYDNKVIEYAKEIKPSKRGELEISSINQIYIEKSHINIEILGRGFAWLDTGTNESLLEASVFIETIQKRQGFRIACLEEIAIRNKWVSKDSISKIMNNQKSEYAVYVRKLLEKNINGYNI